jgi:hypothetical protein
MIAFCYERMLAAGSRAGIASIHSDATARPPQAAGEVLTSPATASIGIGWGRFDKPPQSRTASVRMGATTHAPFVEALPTGVSQPDRTARIGLVAAIPMEAVKPGGKPADQARGRG